MDGHSTPTHGSRNTTVPADTCRRAAGPVTFAGLATITGYRTLLLATGLLAVGSGVVALAFARGRREAVPATEETV